jgi:hypothetical protein
VVPVDEQRSAAGVLELDRVGIVAPDGEMSTTAKRLDRSGERPTCEAVYLARELPHGYYEALL